MAHISWSAPADYSEFQSTTGIEGYRVQIIDDTTTTPYVTKTVNGTSIKIENVSNASCLQINSVYCNGQLSKPLLSPILLSVTVNTPGTYQVNDIHIFLICRISLLELIINDVFVTVDCDKAHIEWTIPETLKEYNIMNYIVNFGNFTFETQNTSIDIMLNDSGLSFNNPSHTGKLWANVCGSLTLVSDKFTYKSTGMFFSQVT